MCDVRLIDNIKRTSGINLEGPSLIRRSQKVWDPPKKCSNCANDEMLIHKIEQLGLQISNLVFTVFLGSQPETYIWICTSDLLV